MKYKLILGGPGTGKTTTLLNFVEQQLAEGVPPERIAYVSYTKKAADEAAERAMERFSLSRVELPYFRTVHSLCYQALGLRRQEVMGPADYKELGNLLGLTFTGRGSVEDGAASGSTEGDQYLSLISFARATRRTLDDAYDYVAEFTLDRWRLRQVADALSTYKQHVGKVDFDDMLTQYIKQDLGALPVDIAIVDEAQDNSANQWAVVRMAFSKCRQVVYAGDDDQALYQWAGADVKQFLSLEAERTILQVSYRLPRPIWRFANDLVGRIGLRYPKDWAPATHEGKVERLIHIRDVPIEQEGSWMFLARNHLLLKIATAWLRSNGIAYRIKSGSSVKPEHVRAIVTWERKRAGRDVTKEDAKYAERLSDKKPPANRLWHDALVGIPLYTREYYRSILRGGGRLQDDPRIYVGTIHSVKGGEADNVVLLTDMSFRTWRGFQTEPDAEHRAYYVGATRARRSLYVMEPATQYSYPM